MDRASSTETPDSLPTQVPVQNFPDYLRYVMMKSMAGFGKVHGELSRLYYSVSDKPSRLSHQVHTSETPTGRLNSFRKRYSTKEGYFKPQCASQSFTSYIDEEDEHEESSKEPRSAPPVGCRKEEFKFNKNRESMPYSELINDAIYINDRVLHVEQEDDNSQVSESNEYVEMDNGGGPFLKQPENSPNTCIVDKPNQRSMLTPNTTVSSSTCALRNDNTSDSEDDHDYNYPSSWMHAYINVPDKRTEKELNIKSDEIIDTSNTANQCNDERYGQGNRSPANEIMNRAGGTNANVSQEESDYDVPVPGVRPINTPTGTMGDYDVPKAFKPDIVNTSLENDYDIPKPHWKISNNDGASLTDTVNSPKWAMKTSNGNAVKNSNAASKNSPKHTSHRAIANNVHGETAQSIHNKQKPFSEFNVDEVVECLNQCSLTKLAKLCQDEHMDGAYLCKLTEVDLIKEPFIMNWFHISKLTKVIKGWRPNRLSSHSVLK